MLGLPVTALDCGEIGGAGTAPMAGRAVGAYGGVSILAKKRKVFYADKVKHEYYMKQLKKYKKIYGFAKEILE